MSHRSNLLAVACGLFSLLVAVRIAPAQEKKQLELTNTKHVRVLTVGNSFTRNALRFLDDLATAAGHRLTHEAVIVGGSPLQLHASKALAFEENAEDPDGRYANGKSLQDLLQADNWDVVTIQQASIKSHDLQTYQPYATHLAELIHRYAPQAQLLVHQTWAYRSDDPRFSKLTTKPGEPASQEAMYRGLANAYQSITSELGANRIPVGDAFHIADTDPKFGYRKDALFNPNTANFPQLPDQQHSLHVGWQWKKQHEAQTLQLDGHHANTAGEYLGGCVWFEALFGESVIGNSFVPASLDPQYANFLQGVAHRAMNKSQDVPRGVGVNAWSVCE